MLTYLTDKHRMRTAVAGQDVYFPVPCSKANVAMFGDGNRVEEFLTPNSRTVHLWSQFYQKVLGPDRPKPDTWVGRKCAELAI